MIKLYECLKNDHDWRLVMLAALICLVSSYTASMNLERAKSRSGLSKMPWILMLSGIIGFGIWATHFVAMLAYEPSVGFSYDPQITILSLIIIIGLSIPAFSLIVQSKSVSLTRVGAALLGLGISAMHYTGMYGLLPHGFMQWDMFYVMISVICGVVFSIAAIEIHRLAIGRKAQLIFASLFTAGICADHFFGMSALTLLPLSEGGASGNGVSPMIIGALIGAAAIILLQVSIVLSVFDSWVLQKKNADKKRNQELETLLISIGELARIGSWSLDVDTMKPNWSVQLLKFLNVKHSDDLSLEAVAQHFSDESKACFLTSVKTACQTGGGFDLDLSIEKEGEATLWVRAVCKPFIENGATTKLIGLFQDITEHKLEKDRLKTALHEADQANKLKTEFLATMSHELRTPLNGVLGMAQLLEATSLDSKQRRFTETILTSGNSLLAIISDILDISRIEAGLLEVHEARFDPRVLAENAVANVKGIALQKDLSIKYEVKEAVKTSYVGDDMRIRQILINLLGNALKFTEKGGVKLLLKEGVNDSLEFYVIDSGLGIAKAKQVEIFKPFTQADGSSTRKYGGTGLGLSICQDLANLMGGSLGVQSMLGKGAVFWFKLPAKHMSSEGGNVVELPFKKLKEPDLGTHLEPSVLSPKLLRSTHSAG